MGMEERKEFTEVFIVEEREVRVGEWVGRWRNLSEGGGSKFDIDGSGI